MLNTHFCPRCDLLPVMSTRRVLGFPVNLKQGRSCNVTQAIHRGADHRYPQRARDRVPRAGSGTPARRVREHDLSLGIQVRRHGGLRCQAATGSLGRQPAPQASVRRRHARQRRAVKKVVTPAGRRRVAGYLSDAHGLSQRRACRLVGLSPTVARYQPQRASDAARRDRLTLVSPCTSW